MQDDFVLQAMMGGDGLGGGGLATQNPNTAFPQIKLRYDENELETELAAIEEAVEDDLLDEEETGLQNGGFVFGGNGGRGNGGDDASDAGTDRDDLDEHEWAEQRQNDVGADLRDVDEMFEAMKHGYDSDEIGELEDDDPRIFGHAELDRFGSILEEFRKEQRPTQYRTPVDLVRGGANAGEMDRRKHAMRLKDDDALFEDDGPDDVDMKDMSGYLKKLSAELGDDDDIDEDGIPKNKPAVPRITEADVHDAFRAMIATRQRIGLSIPEHLMEKMSLEEGGMDSVKKTNDKQLVTRRRFEEESPSGAPDGEEIEYLRNAPRDDWDCETIVSTYSNLENPPSLIDEPHLGGGRGGKGAQRRFNLGSEKSNDDGNGVGASLIRLSDANGLPVDYVRSRGNKQSNARGGSLLTAENLAAIGEEGGASDGNEFSDSDESLGEEWRSNIRRKGETPEEKKMRKAAVKLGRRDARAAKKGLKTTFKQEEREMGKKAMVGDIRPGLSVTQLG